ncbi:MAG: hypothetical protein WC556_05240 [Candidatus Methanoperedens sp.]
MNKKDMPFPITSQEEHNKLSIRNNAVFGNKCIADTECNESPSAGWQFVKYCMRG